MTSCVSVDRIEASIEKCVGAKGESHAVSDVARRVMEDVFRPAPRYTLLEPEWYAVSFFVLYVSASDVGEFQAKNRRMPFPTHSVKKNYVVNVPVSICVPVSGSDPCVVCAKPMLGSRMIQGCCAAHSCHVDCYGVAKVCHGGSRACFGGLFGECVPSAKHHTSVAYYQVQEMQRNVVDVLSRAPNTDSKSELVRAAQTALTWFPVHGATYAATGREMDPSSNPRDKKKKCTVCTQTITDSQSGIVTCSAHCVHSSCYAMWRSFRDRAGVSGVECPGKWMDGVKTCSHSGSCI